MLFDEENLNIQKQPSDIQDSQSTEINFVAMTQESREQSDSIVTNYIEKSAGFIKEEEVKQTLDQII